MASRGEAAQSVIVKPTGCAGVLPFNTQCLQNSAESGERSV